MAVEGDEADARKGLRCLTIARWMAAAMVAVPAVMVVLMVLTAGLRPESISVSVTHGHIQSAQLLWTKSEFILPHYRHGWNQSLPIYSAASSLDFWVSLGVVVFDADHHNPSGGATNMSCNVTTVCIFDMPNAPSFLDMVEIANISVGKEICNGTHHRAMDRWIHVSDQDTLGYIAKTYGGVDEFTAMLRLQVAINKTVPAADAAGARWNVTSHDYYCWPVTIGHSRSTTSDEAITCKPGHHIDYTAGARNLTPPAPPPPSASGPPSDSEICRSNDNTASCCN
ncbi:hypothetical protein BS78_05G114900 [Paspalum vaginatum]|nr:hypothetical protein BS78_05G114900 [Paspalum vaginatum]